MISMTMYADRSAGFRDDDMMITPGLLLKITFMLITSRVTLIVMMACRFGVNVADLGQRKIEQFMSGKLQTMESENSTQLK